MCLRWGADPGLHPGLVELALQAEIAGGSGQWVVRSEQNVEPRAVQSDSPLNAHEANQGTGQRRDLPASETDSGRTITSFDEYQHAALSLRGIGEAGPNVVSREIRQVIE